MRAFVVRFSFSIPIGLRKRLQNDLFCFQWDVKPLNQSINWLLLCDAMLVWVLAMTACMPVCLTLSQVGLVFCRKDGQIELVFDLSTLCYNENQISTKMKVLPSAAFS